MSIKRIITEMLCYVSMRSQCHACCLATNLIDKYSGQTLLPKVEFWAKSKFVLFPTTVSVKRRKSGVYCKCVYDINCREITYFFSISIKYIVIVLMSAFTRETTNEFKHLTPASQFIVHLLFSLESFVVLKHLKCEQSHQKKSKLASFDTTLFFIAYSQVHSTKLRTYILSFTA